MTVSPLRFPLSTAHNRKRRSFHPLQQKTVKSKPVLAHSSLVETSASAEMSVHTEPKREYPAMEEQLNSIFREKTSIWVDSRDSSDTEDEETWTLKRASPITEEEDDDADQYHEYESPSKRAKVQTVLWESRLSDDEPFSLDDILLGAR
jgi:hypothetical protein